MSCRQQSKSAHLAPPASGLPTSKGVPESLDQQRSGEANGRTTSDLPPALSVGSALPGRGTAGSPALLTSSRAADPEYQPAQEVPALPGLSALVASALRRSGRHGRPDDRLIGVAEDLVHSAGQLEPQVLADLLAYHGVVEPDPDVVRLEAARPQGATSDDSKLALHLLEALPDGAGEGPWGLGVVRRPTTVLVTFVSLPRALAFKPFPRRLEPDDRTAFRFSVPPPWSSLAAVAQTPRGRLGRIPVVRESKRNYAVDIRCNGMPGIHRIEVFGDEGRGPQVLAVFPLYCGVPVDNEFALSPSSTERLVSNEEDLAQDLLRLINVARDGVGLNQLLSHSGLSEVAVAHSRNMATAGELAHKLSGSENASVRVQRKGLMPLWVAENVGLQVSTEVRSVRVSASELARKGLLEAEMSDRVGRASKEVLDKGVDPQAFHKAFMKSPGHRANIIADEATHVGIGVARARSIEGRITWYVTQVFAKF